MPIRDTRILIKDLDPLVGRVKSKRLSLGEESLLPREAKPCSSILA
jgi:hypothetical protein